MTIEAEHRALSQVAAAGFSPSGLERFKLDRLRELRAVIDALRTERELVHTGRSALFGGYPRHDQ